MRGTLLLLASAYLLTACTEIYASYPDSSFHGEDAALPLWSTFQAEAKPKCRVEPADADDVALLLVIIRRHGCHFAVLGGGTSPYSGASNAEQGITIDLGWMRDFEVLDGEDLRVKVGGGTRWAEVYSALDPLNMSMTGTRNSLTGVVGSFLGGGISFFSESHGWTCDTLTEVEVVLANSTVATASPSQNADLFWAIKGGGNNFAIVTSATLQAFRNPPTWYTFQRFDIDDLSAVFDRLEAFTTKMPGNVSQLATTFQWHIPTQQFVISERMVAYELPDLPKNIVRKARNGTILSSPVLQTNSYQRTILDMAEKMTMMNADGFYNFFGSVTIGNNAVVAERFAEIFEQEVVEIDGATGLQVYIVYNPLTLQVLGHMRKHGGNALGISREDGPLIIVNINLHWSDPADEPIMRAFMRRLIQRFQSAAADLGAAHPYIFQNHAFEEQRVFEGYGTANVRRLKSIRQHVDPTGVFQTLQPGFFKLGYSVESEHTEKLEL